KRAWHDFSGRGSKLAAMTTQSAKRQAAEPLESRPDPVPPADGAREAVIVTHGLWMPGWETLLLRRRLEAAGYTTVPFVYPTVGCGLDENAEKLAEFAARVP